MKTLRIAVRLMLLCGIGAGCSSNSQTGVWIRVISPDVAISQARLYIYDAAGSSLEPVAWHDVPEVPLPTARVFDLNAQDPQNQLWVLVLAGREVQDKIRVTGIGYNNKREVAFGEMGVVTFKAGAILDGVDGENRPLVLELSGCTDNDGDGYCPPSDCDDADGQINPEAMERCGDGRDNNCNGTIEEDCPCQPGDRRDCWPDWAPAFEQLCQPKGDQGEYSCPCRQGQQDCQNGTWGLCQDLILPRSEDCDNNLDDNCNGFQDKKDLGCGGCVPGSSDACYNGPDGTRNVGQCKEGIKFCRENGSWSEICEGEITPTDEICDGYDNDCDKIIDNNLKDVPDCSLHTGCCTGALQVCQGGSGYRDCTDDEYRARALENCGAADNYGQEKCDNLDNDCDGETDEGQEAVDDCQRKYPSLANADISGCSAGQCLMVCRGLWGNCNTDINDGCETPLNTLTNCGSCASVCSCPICQIPDCSSGTCQCSNVPQGQDPYGQCPTDTCKTGACDGNGACENLPAGYEGSEGGGQACPVCQDCGSNGTCVAVSRNVKDVGCDATCKVCDGSGNCGNVSQGQDPFDECPAATCKTGTCDGQGKCGDLSAGAEGNEGGGLACPVCQDCNGSGACTLVGYSKKDNGCDGICRMCDGSGNCTNVPRDEDPNSDCPAATCKTGFCDGNGACGNLPAGSEGNEGGGTACPTCKDCNGNGNCVNVTNSTKDNGCSGTCTYCVGGSCTNVPIGQDPLNDCTPSGCISTGNCNGAGACEVPAPGTDPNNYCPAATCKTGFCDGNGACGNLPAGSEGNEGGGAACPTCQDCGSNGSCVAVNNAKDVGCIDLCKACYNGSCGNVPNNQDPFGECSPVECQSTDYCGGNGACAMPADGIECGSRYCNGNQFIKKICQSGSCSGTYVIETCNANETCTSSGCFCGNSGLNCVGNDINYCCLNNPEGCYNITNNPQHCGTSCTNCGQNAYCNNGSCACNVGYANCDSDWTNGCEVNLTNDINNCGSCNTKCTNNHGTTSCVGSQCQPFCNPPTWSDCDGDPSNGCETSLCNDQNCGSCQNSCTPPAHCNNSCTECQ